mgnify:CR=1 FL=1
MVPVDLTAAQGFILYAPGLFWLAHDGGKP